MKERGWETYGVDPATAALLRDRGHLMLDEMPEAPAFDLVIIKHVLEHIRDPLTILRQARKCIRDGGYLFVGTPSLDRLTEHEKLRYCINPSKHIVAFTTRSMRNLLAMAEFRVDTILEPDRPQRLALLARPAADVPHEPAPLRDARRELRAFLIQKEGRLAAWTPVRRRAFIANAKILREHQRRQAARTVKPGKANRSASPGGARERSA